MVACRRCEFENFPKGCALKYEGKACRLILEDRSEDADAELSYAEEHLKEM
ncbi:MAG: hypothetical protein ACETWE_14035 [Candidatus Bathyarchaeia archaeon]